MKVIVTGENGRLSRRIKELFEEKDKNVSVLLMSVRGNEWEKQHYGDIDAIIHCAGIIGNESTTKEDYYQVNVVLTERVYKFARDNKIRHFIYLSSMAVYDATHWGIKKDGIITSDTNPCAASNYGNSKLLAESVLQNANYLDTGTTLSIVRAPSIVGKGMETYFASYEKLLRFPFVICSFVNAKRSFVYIETLVEFLFYIIETGTSGILFPQNLPLLSVSEIWEEISKSRGQRKIRFHIPEKIVPSLIAKRFFCQICYDERLSLEINEQVGEISSREAIWRCMDE